MEYGVISIFVAIVLIILEFFVPGGILGTLGTLLYIFGIVLVFLKADSIATALVITALTLFILVNFMRYALRRIEKGKSKICSEGSQEGYIASEVKKDLHGVRGEVSSDLKPSGYILIDGKRLQAVSKMGYLPKGTSIEIINSEGAHYIVKKLEEE